MYPWFINTSHHLKYFIIIIREIHEIQVIGINNQNPHFMLLPEKIKISLLYFFKICRLNVLFIDPTPLRNISFKVIKIQVKINKQIRFREDSFDDIK